MDNQGAHEPLNQKIQPTNDCLDVIRKSSSVAIRKSSHSNPDWLKQFTKTLKDRILEECCKKVQYHVQEDIKIEDVRLKKEIRGQIIDFIVDSLLKIFEVGKPGIAEVRKIVNELEFIYPNMFKFDESTGHGLGGREGNTTLPNQILTKLRKKSLNSNKLAFSVSELNAEKDQKKSCGKKKKIYGIDNDLYYSVKKSDPTLAAKISKANEESSFEAREEIYSSNRSELIAEFRFSKKSVPNICRGFFLDPRHSEIHFTIMTGHEGLTRTVTENIVEQMSKYSPISS